MGIRRHTKVFTVFSFLRLRSPDIYWYQWIYPTSFFVMIYLADTLIGDAFFNPLDRPKLSLKSMR